VLCRTRKSRKPRDPAAFLHHDPSCGSSGGPSEVTSPLDEPFLSGSGDRLASSLASSDSLYSCSVPQRRSDWGFSLTKAPHDSLPVRAAADDDDNDEAREAAPPSRRRRYKIEGAPGRG